MIKFHRRCGDRVTLLNEYTTAVRNFVEFNHGLIFSAEHLKDDVVFEICIDTKVSLWNGSLEIGVVSSDPEYFDLPPTATKLRNTAWIMSGCSIVEDGVTILNNYGPELETLNEGDCVGVMRTRKAELVFFINGKSLGVAARNLPSRVLAVIDLYGQCVQVSIIQPIAGRNFIPYPEETPSVQVEEDPNNDDTLTPSELNAAGVSATQTTPKFIPHILIPMTEMAYSIVHQEHLRFHPRCGILVKLSNNNKSAERARPLDDYNNGVVMTHRPLGDNELFQVRIEKLVDKWSGSIELGVTIHNPSTMRFPSTMTNMDSGTIMMSGSKVLLNGNVTCMEYRNINLDELKEGDTVGMIRKSDKLHYFLNGVDQGMATDKVDPQVWGVVDLYGMTVKVSIVDPCDEVVTNINPPSLQSSSYQYTDEYPPPPGRAECDEHTLLFHTLRDSNVIIINDGKTAHRPNAFEYFNNGIVMTNRSLRTGELFQVRLDLVIPKWAGSIEIGVTQHTSNDIKLPFRMSNAKSGTWAMTGEDVIRDGSIIIPQYVRNLNTLVEGDTVGVMRKDMGILHFFVNGIDQGPAAFNIPEHVFGIVDLYGRVAQATIVDYYMAPIYSPESPLSAESMATVYPEMCFHQVHGRNAHLSRNRLTATRGTVYSEFNDAVLFSSRPLRECDMFELRIDNMVDFWIGSLELGVTAIRPEDLDGNGGVGAVAGTATDLNWDTYILSGAAMMKDGECVRSGYPLDLDTLTVGSRVGLMWHADRSLHYYLDGMDMGKAWYVPHLNIYAVVDLYGQCTQNEERAFNYNGCTNSDNSLLSNFRSVLSPPPPYWSFSEYCGENICLMHDYSYAQRLTPDPYCCLVFSSGHLAVGEMFEIKIVECKSGYAGTFRMGVTDINVLNAYVNRFFPPSVRFLPHYTAYIDGKFMKYSQPGPSYGRVKQENVSFVPSFEWLHPGDRVGLKKTSDGRVQVYYNSELTETCFENVPDKVYVIMELTGNVTKIQAVPQGNAANTLQQATIPNYEYGTPMMPMTECQGFCNNYNMTQETNGQIDPEDSYSKYLVPTCTATGEEQVETEPGASTEAAAGPSGVVPTETKKRRHPLPYTFHYIHGNNIKLCSSDTVAVRTSSYKHGIAIVSQALWRGHKFRFRVDKINREWSGSLAIGAVGVLPTEDLPQSAVELEAPVWVISSDYINNNGQYIKSDLASALDELVEQSMLTIHFRFNSELVIAIDGKVIGSIASVARKYSSVFPMIDLYGKIQQVSVLLHPMVVTSGTSLDLPVINEELQEESVTEFETHNDYVCCQAEITSTPEVFGKAKAYSQVSLLKEEYDSVIVKAGSSTDLQPTYTSLPQTDNCVSYDLTLNPLPPNPNSENVVRPENVPLPEDDSFEEEAPPCPLQKSHSSSDCFCLMTEDFEREVKESQPDNGVGSRAAEDTGSSSNTRFFDTNIRHNDRYPEASDVDNLDNEIMDALTLETGNLPDLTEEQSSSIDESTRRDDYWAEPLTAENLNYLNRILCLDQDGTEGQSLESEWEASGEGCEHLHLVLKYWNFLVLPYPELRRAVSWGQVKCYCNSCQPDAQPPLSGWVRIERIDGVGAARRGFWHVSRSTLGSAQAAPDGGLVRRPRSLVAAPCPAPPLVDIWFDEEGKPHHTVLAIEIDIEGSDADFDRLLAFLIYMKPHVVFSDDNPPSLDE